MVAYGQMVPTCGVGTLLAAALRPIPASERASMTATGTYLHQAGVWCRSGDAADAYVIAERTTYDPLRIQGSDVVLDLGAHIGVVARQLLERGAARLIAVEPYGPNVEMLRLNLSRWAQDRCTIVPAAVVGEDHSSEFAELRVPKDNLAMCSLVDHGAPYAVMVSRCTVEAIRFDHLLATHRPTVLKVDIEAGEYALLPSLSRLPCHVRTAAVEWHNFEPHLHDGGFHRAYRETHARLLACGFAVTGTSGAMIAHEHSAVLHIYERSAS